MACISFQQLPHSRTWDTYDKNNKLVTKYKPIRSQIYRTDKNDIVFNGNEHLQNNCFTQMRNFKRLFGKKTI